LRLNPLNAEIIPICHLLALLGAHHILHVSRIRVNGATRLQMNSSGGLQPALYDALIIRLVANLTIPVDKPSSWIEHLFQVII
jgi:hypothetical protein